MAAAAKLRLEALLGKKLPFDDQVLEYLLRVAPASDTMELLELVEDFCPKWPKHERASLAAKLKSEAQGEGNGQLGQDSSSHVPASSSSSSAKPAAEGEDRGGRSAWGGGQQRVGGGAGPTQTGDGQSSSGPTAASAELLAADMLLAQMLQEEEDAQATIGHQPQPGNKKGGKKPSYKPMNISYNLSRGGAAGASFGTGLPSSLADVLRNRRSQDAQAVGFLSEHFGPPAAREGAASKWAPAADLQGMTWAERAQQASAQVAEEEAAIASMEARADKAVAKVAPSGPVAAGAMRVRIRTVEGVEYLVDANPSETVGDVKYRLEKAQGIPFVQQRLIHLGRELLQDSLELKAVGFRDGQCNLQLALRSAGELPPATRQQPPQPSQQVLGDIRLELPGGKSASLSSLPWDVTGAMLKQRIEVQHGIRLEHMELSFFGMRLEDDLALREQGVASGALISVEIAPPTYSASGEYFPKVGVGVADKQLLGKMSRKQQQDQMAGLQTSEFGRVMDENEALRLAMAASMAGPGSVAAFGRALDDDEGEAEDPGQDQAEACDMDKVEFLGDVAAQEKSMANSVSQAKSLATSLAYKDVISRVSKRSGYRLTLITDKTKKARPVLGYAVCRFPPKGQRTLNVLQVGISEQHRGLGLGRQMVRWLVQYAKKAATAIDVIAVSCPSGGTSFYEKLGFRASASQGLDGEDQMDGHVCLEYKFQTKASVAASKGAKKGKQEPMARPELLKLVFEACDADADGFLNQQEMGHFAVQTGFDGGDDAWAQEFATLCGDNGITGARGGVNASLFAKLVDDESDQGIYCTDAELSSMLAILAPPKPASVSSKTKKFDSRSEVVREVFKRLDTNGAGFLRSQEMLPFANHTGFDGSDADWAEEFQSLCSEPGSAQGVGVEHFARLVDDESDNGCYCTDEELRDLMAKLRPVAPVPASPAAQHSNGAPSFAKESDSRSEVVREVFKRLDTNRAGFLSAQDMLPFANHTGFDGSDADWAEEFQSLCSEPGSSQGVGAEHFARLVDDESDDGCYCTDEELRDLLAKLPEQAAPVAPVAPVPAEPAAQRGNGSLTAAPSFAKDSDSRSEVVREVFKRLDTNRAGFLSAQDMLPFANHTGFDGSDADWAEEFQSLCSEPGSSQGVGVEHFARLVDDESDDGCYCSDEELRDLLAKLPEQEFLEVAQPLAEALGSGVQPLAFQGDLPLPPAVARSRPPPGLPPPPPGLDPPQRPPPGNGEGGGGGQFFQDQDGFNSFQDVPSPSGKEEGGRSELLRSVFELCDRDRDGRLSAREMYLFAAETGFQGSFSSEWEEEFVLLCTEKGVDPQQGISLEAFSLIANDEADFCTDEELGSVMSALQLQAVPLEEAGGSAPSSSRAPRPSGTVAPASRSTMVSGVFRALDADGDGHLNMSEMKVFAVRVGFDGGDADWAAEFASLCAEHGSSVSPLGSAAGLGIDAALFARLVDDESDNGCYSSDAELRALLRDLLPAVRDRNQQLLRQLPPPDEANLAGRPRTELVRAVFKVLDVREAGRLQASEMRRFAELCGFKGNDAEWAEEYAALFDAGGGGRYGPPEGGISPALFAELADDQSDTGCFCTDSELCLILDRLEPGVREPLLSAMFLVLDRSGKACLDRADLRFFRQSSDDSSAPAAITTRLVAALEAVCAKPLGEVSKDDFRKLVDGKLDGQFGRCTNETLRVLLVQLRARSAGQDEDCEDHLDELQELPEQDQNEEEWADPADIAETAWEPPRVSSGSRRGQQSEQAVPVGGGRVWRPTDTNEQSSAATNSGKGGRRKQDEDWWDENEQSRAAANSGKGGSRRQDEEWWEEDSAWQKKEVGGIRKGQSQGWSEWPEESWTEDGWSNNGQGWAQQSWEEPDTSKGWADGQWAPSKGSKGGKSAGKGGTGDKGRAGHGKARHEAEWHASSAGWAAEEWTDPASNSAGMAGGKGRRRQPAGKA